MQTSIRLRMILAMNALVVAVGTDAHSVCIVCASDGVLETA